jgi:hypothetical protein
LRRDAWRHLSTAHSRVSGNPVYHPIWVPAKAGTSGLEFAPWLRVLVSLFGLSACLFTHSALAQPTVEDFYRGKQVNLIVGYGPGGGYDLVARLVARHLGRYVPSNPK